MKNLTPAQQKMIEEFDEKFGSDCGRIHVGAGEKNIEMTNIKAFLLHYSEEIRRETIEECRKEMLEIEKEAFEAGQENGGQAEYETKCENCR